MWAHIERSLANLTVAALDPLEKLVRNRVKRLQYRPDAYGELATPEPERPRCRLLDDRASLIKARAREAGGQFPSPACDVAQRSSTGFPASASTALWAAVISMFRPGPEQ